MICNVKLTIHLCIVLRIRMSGTTPLLHPYAFMAWTGAVLPFTVIKHDYGDKVKEDGMVWRSHM